jgi:histidinol phosphatase-like enzyme
LEAARELGIDLERSYMVGDKVSDTQAGIRAGVRATILCGGDNGGGPAESDATFIAKNFNEAVEFILGC